MQWTERESTRDRTPRTTIRRSHAGVETALRCVSVRRCCEWTFFGQPGGETDADPPHPRPKLAWRTPHHGAATRKER